MDACPEESGAGADSLSIRPSLTVRAGGEGVKMIAALSAPSDFGGTGTECGVGPERTMAPRPIAGIAHGVPPVNTS
jgi:hypothetical protein